MNLTDRDFLDLAGIEWLPVEKRNSFKVDRCTLALKGEQEPKKGVIFGFISGSGFCYTGIAYHKDAAYIYIQIA